MRIKLINPRMICRPTDGRLKFKLLPPQSLLLLGALTPDQHEVILVDENVRDDDPLDAQPDLVAMPIFVATANRGYVLADSYRRRGIPVVLGGLHATSCPDEAKQHADSVVIGEAEELWPRLLADLERGCLAPFYRNDHTISLDRVPFLRRDLVDSRWYASVSAMRTSRGCPHRCNFCYQSAFYPTRGVRNQPLGRIVSEIRSMKSKHVLLLDDNIIGNRRFARELFRELIALGITWSGASTVSIGDDPELLDLAWRSGCRSLFIGFESLSQTSLNEHGKNGNKVLRFRESVDAIHSKGIMVNGSFIFGLDHDGPDIFEKTVEWIVSSRIETATFHILTPYPGTELFRSLDEQGRIIDRDLDHYNTAHAVFQPAGMTPQQLEEGYRWAYRNVYSWPNVLRRAPTVPSLKLPYWGFVLGYKKFAPVTALLSRLGMMESLFSWFADILLSRAGATSIPVGASLRLDSDSDRTNTPAPEGVVPVADDSRPCLRPSRHSSSVGNGQPVCHE